MNRPLVLIEYFCIVNQIHFEAVFLLGLIKGDNLAFDNEMVWIDEPLDVLYKLALQLDEILIDQLQVRLDDAILR